MLEKIENFPASDVPPPIKAEAPYRELLEKIGKGDAVFLTERQVSLNTASAAIRRLRKEQKFKNFKVTRRTVDGQKRLYTINEDK